MQEIQAATYWDRFAEAYANLGPPLRLSGEEVGMMEGVIREWAVSRRLSSPQALILGSTPELANMRWPAGTRVMGMDCSFPMAKGVWPGDVPGRRAMVCADWLAMPRRRASCDVVAGDGSINCLPYPLGFRALAETLAEVLGTHGLLVLRCYAQAERRESAGEIYAQALGGGIGSFHAFKLRLLMALQESARAGVAVNDVYRWVSRNVDFAELRRRTGWAERTVDTIGYYKDSTTVYAFPTCGELCAEMAPRFEEVARMAARHEMGPRCPIFAFRARNS